MIFDIGEGRAITKSKLNSNDKNTQKHTMIQIGTKPKKKSFIESESSEYFWYFICLCSLNESKFIQNTYNIDTKRKYSDNDRSKTGNWIFCVIFVFKRFSVSLTILF